MNVSVKLPPERYEPYRKKVAEIKSGQSNALYLGEGAESSVWRVRNDGADYVVKIANSTSPRGRPRDTYEATIGKINSGIKGIGIKGLEQIIAASPQDGAAIYKYAEGSCLQYTSESTLRRVTPKQIEDLWQTVLIASQRGIEFDGWNDEEGNVLYDSTDGFTLIDYWATNRPIPFERNRKYVTRSMGTYGLQLERYSPITPTVAELAEVGVTATAQQEPSEAQ